MSSNKFFVKYGLQDNHWVGYSVMNPIDAVLSQNINTIREGNIKKWKIWNGYSFWRQAR